MSQLRGFAPRAALNRPDVAVRARCEGAEEVAVLVARLKGVARGGLDTGA